MRLILKPTRTNRAHAFPTVFIEVPDDDLNLHDTLSFVVMPALVAWGFDSRTVRGYFGEEQYEESEHG